MTPSLSLTPRTAPRRLSRAVRNTAGGKGKGGARGVTWREAAGASIARIRRDMLEGKK